MMIRQEFETLPPKPFLWQVLDKISKTYVFLWDRKDQDNKISLLWDEVRKEHSKNCFRSCLRKLCNEGLLNYEESAKGVTIELVGWDDIEG
jgi:hypothetical protein